MDSRSFLLSQLRAVADAKDSPAGFRTGVNDLLFRVQQIDLGQHKQ